MQKQSTVSWFDGVHIERKPALRRSSAETRQMVQFLKTAVLTGFTGITGFGALALLLTAPASSAGIDLGEPSTVANLISSIEMIIGQ